MKHARPLAITAVTLASLGVALPAAASWAANGSGTVTATARTLAAPGAPVQAAPAPTTTTISLSWAAASAPGSDDLAYHVERAPFGATTTWSSACSSSETAPLLALSCTDTGLSPATDYVYRVTSVFHGWRARSATSGKLTTATAAQPAVTVSTPDLLAADDSGASSTDNLTRVAAPRFTGTATPGASVVLMEGTAARSATVIADASGAWTATVSGPLSQGAHTISATATKSGATTGTSPSALTVTVDTVAPMLGAVSVATNGGSDNGKGLSGTASTPTTHPGVLASVAVSVSGTGCSVTPASAAIDPTTGSWSGPTVSLSNNSACDATVMLDDAAGNQTSVTVRVTRGGKV